MSQTPGEIELYSYFSQHFGPRFEVAGLRVQFHYNQTPGIHFKVAVSDEYRNEILRGIQNGMALRFPKFPKTGSIWITEVTEHEVGSCQRAFYRAGFAIVDQAYSLAVQLESENPLDRAIRNLGWRRLFRSDEYRILIACLVREADWRPLRAPWWRGKEVSVIGADLEGNLFLRHYDGTIRYWDHSTKADAVLAPSVRDFIAGIVDENETAQPPETV